MEQVLKEGQDIEVTVVGVDKQGRVKLEWKDKPQAEPKAAETTTEEKPATEAPTEEEE